MQLDAVGNRYSQDKLNVKNFLTADALKAAIRTRIRDRLQSNWGLCSIKSKGSYIALIFVQNADSIPVA